jgi:hypothetical protein
LAEKAPHFHLQPLILHAPLNQDPIHLHNPRRRLERIGGQGQRLCRITQGYGVLQFFQPVKVTCVVIKWMADLIIGAVVVMTDISAGIVKLIVP